MFFQVEFDIVMRDDDGSSFREIDTFEIMVPFPSGNQEEVFTGNKGIANITLSYDIIFVEHDVCTPTVTSSKSIGTHLQLYPKCTVNRYM